MAFFTVTHDPDARLDYGFDWSDPDAEGGPWLAVGETITASTWEMFERDGVTPTVEILVDTDSHTTTTTTLWLVAVPASRGKGFKATNHIVTSQGRKEDRSIAVNCKEK